MDPDDGHDWVHGPMPGKDGFAVQRDIAGTHAPAVVFITAHDEHAIRAFEVQAVDDVLKPVAVKTDRGVIFIPAADIHWIEADGDLVNIHTARGHLVMRSPMAEMASRLATPPFTRVHRSVIVNVDCIRAIQPLFKGGYVIALKTGAQIRTGRTHRANVQRLMRGV